MTTETFKYRLWAPKSAYDGWHVAIWNYRNAEWTGVTMMVNGGPQSGFCFDTRRQALQHALRRARSNPSMYFKGQGA
jgi:hypothetical protein